MDTLKTISDPPTQKYGPVQVFPKKDDKSVGSVSAIATTKPALPASSPEQQAPENQQQIADAVKDINNFFQAEKRSLVFTLDQTSGHMVMQIKNIDTNEVIRQIPNEDVLKLAKRMDDLTGILFKARA